MFSALHPHPFHPRLIFLSLPMEMTGLDPQTGREVEKTVVMKVLKTGIVEW